MVHLHKVGKDSQDFAFAQRANKKDHTMKQKTILYVKEVDDNDKDYL